MNAHTTGESKMVNHKRLEDILRWFTEVEQPEGTILHHLAGPYYTEENGWRISCSARAAGGRPVIVLNVPPDREYRHMGGIKPITQEEWEEIRADVGEVFSIADAWNGPGCTSGSLSIDLEIHPSIHAALDRYRIGCQECQPGNGTVFCKNKSHTYRQAFALGITNAWERATKRATKGTS